MLSVIRRFVGFLYSTVTYRLTVRPNPQRYVNATDQPLHWEQQGLTIKIADADDFDQLTHHIAKFQGSHRIAERYASGRCVRGGLQARYPRAFPVGCPYFDFPSRAGLDDATFSF